MSYITPDCAKNALSKMKKFHKDIEGLFHNYDMDLFSNLGRRNILLSQAQEKFFAESLSDLYPDVENDGRTGKADIFIGSLSKELECKLTSRHVSGAISLQSDFDTLNQKGKLDYLYVIADQQFEKFAVLHFIDLTVDDFRPLSNGARGKVAMYKHKGMKKCNMLVGDVVDLNQQNLRKLEQRLKDPAESSNRSKILKSINYWTNTPTKYKFQLENV